MTNTSGTRPRRTGWKNFELAEYFLILDNGCLRRVELTEINAETETAKIIYCDDVGVYDLKY